MGQTGDLGEKQPAMIELAAAVPHGVFMPDNTAEYAADIPNVLLMRQRVFPV